MLPGTGCKPPWSEYKTSFGNRTAELQDGIFRRIAGAASSHPGLFRGSSTDHLIDTTISSEGLKVTWISASQLSSSCSSEVANVLFARPATLGVSLRRPKSPRTRWRAQTLGKSMETSLERKTRGLGHRLPGGVTSHPPKAPGGRHVPAQDGRKAGREDLPFSLAGRTSGGSRAEEDILRQGSGVIRGRRRGSPVSSEA